MNNDELKRKIVGIIGDVYLVNAPIKDVFKPIFIEKIADALISAGIGDDKEAKFEADHYWRMWQGALVELEQVKHRAEVAEMDLYIAEIRLKQAEKELSEEGK